MEQLQARAAMLATLNHHRRKEEARALRDSLAAFVRWAWPIVEPSAPLTWNWHLDLICSELEMVTNGETRELVICVPPGTAKSLLVSVFWGAWEFLSRPELRVLHTANDDALVKRDSLRTRAIIESREYRELLELLGAGWSLSDSQNEKHLYATTRSGFRQAFAYGARMTGKRGDRIVVDDPVDVRDAMGSTDGVGTRMAEVVTVFDTVLSSRLNDQRTGAGAIVVIAHRIHVDDLPGELIRRGWRSLVLPMEGFSADHPQRHSKDPREEGELLDPVRFPRDVVERMKATMGAHAWNAQYLQQPASLEGGLFKRDAWQVLPRSAFPSEYDRVFASWDLAFKGSSNSDFCVGFVIGQRGANFYLLHRAKGRFHYGQQKRAVQETAKAFPEAMPVLVEDKANAHALIEDLRSEVPGIILVPARDSKESRAQAWAPVHEAHQLYAPEGAEWVEDMIETFAAFPHGSRDDDVDALGHGIIWALQHPAEEQSLVIGGASQVSYWHQANSFDFRRYRV